MDILVDNVYNQHKMLEFMSMAAWNNLWKIRQDIFNWKLQYIDREEFEAAEQAESAIKNITHLMDSYKKIYEND